MATLYDSDGRKIDFKALKTEQAAAALTGVRSLWHDSVADNLTPVKLARILRAAKDGDEDSFFTLADEMEERDLHYRAVLGVRKRAVKGLDCEVEAASDQKADVELAEAVRRLTKAPVFRKMIMELLDALGKGRSAVEIMWTTQGGRWIPSSYRWRDPRFFMFDPVTRKDILLRDDENPQGRPLPPYKFIRHVPDMKTGIPISGGLAFLIAFSYMCSSYTIKDWLAFAEVYGQPIRVGRYGPQATEEDKRILKAAVANIGSDAAAILPDAMRLEFIETIRQTKGDLFKDLAEWLDKKKSIAVLGQTMTTEEGGSYGQAYVLNEVRHDILESDAEELSDTLNRDLVIPFVLLNFGPQEVYPRVTFPVPKPEETEKLVKSIATLVPFGFRVPQSIIRKKLGLPEPAEGAELLTPAAQTTPTAQNAAFSGTAFAVNTESRHEIDQLIADELAGWHPVIQPEIEALNAMVGGAKTFADVEAGLVELAKNTPAEFARALATAMFKARGLGDGER